MATTVRPPSSDSASPSPPPPPGPKPSGSRPAARMVRGLKWLVPGMRVKRWLALIPVGLLAVFLGVAVLARYMTVDFIDWLAAALERRNLDINSPALYLPLGGTLVILGLTVILAAAVGMVRAIVHAVAPEHMTDLADEVYRSRSLSQGPRIVVIGGGTGLSTLLRGLKQYSTNLTAIVTMTDDGGSSGLLQKQLRGRVLPPGDIRNCLVALADAEPLMQELFQYRFQTREEADGLSGHSFGNLFIHAMADITGDFEQAVERTSSILAIRGRVLPSTVESVILVGEMADGREVTGESAIAHDGSPIRRIKLCPDGPRPLPEALHAIREADIILMGPGSVYTSVVPNLLVTEIAEAISRSRAMKAYICNVMTQPGETDGFTASDHVKVIEEHAGRRVFDYVFVNTARPGADMTERYTKTGAEFVKPDLDVIQARGYRAAKGSFISESAVLRHDPDKLARNILRAWEERPLFGK